MKRGYWLINSNRSVLRRFTEDWADKDQLNKYVFIGNGKIISLFCKERPLLKRREEFKIDKTRKILKRLIAQGYRRANFFD